MIRRLTKSLFILLLIVGCVFAKDGIESANKKHSIGIGFGTNKSFNLIQYTYDFKLSKHISFFALAGLYNLAGLGLSWQSNYNENGFMIGLSSGTDIGGGAFNCISSSYQWQLGNTSKNFYFSLGISSYSIQYYDKVLEEDIKKQEYFPVISLDRRF